MRLIIQVNPFVIITNDWPLGFEHSHSSVNKEVKAAIATFASSLQLLSTFLVSSKTSFAGGSDAV